MKSREDGAIKALLFDFDGVVMDTESLYSNFWRVVGAEHLPEVKDFEKQIKGSTLRNIFDRYFAQQSSLQHEIAVALQEFEERMTFEYIPNCQVWLQQLKQQGIKTAIVTSSDRKKMMHAVRKHPELEQLFDVIVTADDFTESKPHPEGYLTAASKLGVAPQECVVLEDSFHGLEAGRRAGMRLVGLATTNSAESIAPHCDVVIADFTAENIKLIESTLPI